MINETQQKNIEELLLNENLEGAIGLLKSFKSRNPHYSNGENGYLVDYYLGQALFRSTIKRERSVNGVDKSIDLFNKSLEIKEDFADSNLLIGLAYVVQNKSIPNKNSTNYRKKAITHLLRAKELNPDLEEECNKNLRRIIKPHVTFGHYNSNMASILREEFKGYTNVDILNGNLLKNNSDAIVSPSNSFGFMDGGFDQNLLKYLGRNLEHKIQKEIRRNQNGELLVGSSVILETEDTRFPYVIFSPTMRVPQELARESVNVYLAARATFLTIEDYNRESDHIKSVTIPFMGAGVGRMAPRIAAKQMRMAYDDIILGKQEFPKDFGEAQLQNTKLFTNTPKYQS